MARKNLYQGPSSCYGRREGVWVPGSGVTPETLPSFIALIIRDMARGVVYDEETCEPFVPRWSFPSFQGFSGSHLGASTSPTLHGRSAWGHGWRSSPTARGSHLPSARLGLEQGSHRPGGATGGYIKPRGVYKYTTPPEDLKQPRSTLLRGTALEVSV
jgi:hypothetical protein